MSRGPRRTTRSISPDVLGIKYHLPLESKNAWSYPFGTPMAVRRTLPILLCLLACRSLAGASDTTALQPAANTLLSETFRAELRPDQLEALARDAKAEALIAAMSPQQRHGARSRLMELERTRSAADDVAEIALGYRLLGEPKESLRLADRLKSVEPDRARGFSVAAASYVELTDWDAAVREAAVARKRDPSDTMAESIYQLYRHKLAPRGMPTPGGQSAGDESFVQADGGMKGRVAAAARAAARNLDVPMIPVPATPAAPEQGPLSSTAGLAVTSALAAAGALLLFGLGKPLEQRFPNVRRNLAIGALVAAPTVVVVANAPVVVEAVGEAIEASLTATSGPAPAREP